VHLRPPHWAAGDIVEFQGVVWGIIPAAMDHAPVLASNILGKTPAVYRQTIPQNTLKVAGINVTSIGKVIFEKGEEPRYQVIEKADEKRNAQKNMSCRTERSSGASCWAHGNQFPAFATQAHWTP